jgi:hypothetical protein
MVGFCFFLPGCALLQIPFSILGTALEILKKIPLPPPGVF